MKGPAGLIHHLAARGYHPRSDAHSNAICAGLLDDILDHCPDIRARAARGELVARINHTVIRGHERWNLDMAIGPPARVVPPAAEQAIRFETPVLIEIAVEAKGVMTEHGKARHNRLRDLQAFHNHAHNYDKRTSLHSFDVVARRPSAYQGEMYCAVAFVPGLGSTAEE